MPQFWRNCRIAFRCVRFAAWFAALALIAAFLWCNRIGLPGFLKARLVASLQEQGVKLEFSRLRLSLVHGFVADNVRAGQMAAGSPAFAARSVQLQLDFPALLHRRWQLDGLVIRNGNFSLPLSPTNALTLTNLQTELRFLPDDAWALDHFRAEMEQFKTDYANPLYRWPETFNEIFPVGVIVSLVSAGLLRNSRFLPAR